MIFDTSLKVPSFVNLRLLAEMLPRNESNGTIEFWRFFASSNEWIWMNISITKSSKFCSTVTFIFCNFLTVSVKHKKKPGTFKERVSKIIFWNFQSHWSLGSKVNFLSSWELPFVYESVVVLSMFKIGFLLSFPQYLDDICSISSRKIITNL